MSDTYEEKVAATKIYLIRRHYNLRMKESDSITAHLNDYEGIISQLSAQGMTIDDELKALLLMSALPPFWETFVTTVCNVSAAAVKYSETTSSILSEDARTKTFVQNSTSEAYTVQSTGDRQQHRGRSFSRGPNATRNRSKSRGAVTCNYCKKPGHVKTKCRALKVKNGKFTHKVNRTEEVNFCGSFPTTLRNTVKVTPEDDPNILNVESTAEAEVLLMTEDATSWLLDSGVSYDVTPFQTQFQSYTARNLDPLHVGNSQHCAVISTGTVELNLLGGSTIVLHDVRHVLELTWSLISVGQLDEAGFRTNFSSGGWSIHKGNLLLARGLRIHSMYPLYITLQEGDVFVMDIPVSSLWHGRLGHQSKTGITYLSKAGYIPKLSFSDHQFCEHCQYSKQVATHVPRESSPLDLVHSDICGPMPH
jgi:hypothetical protein